ncbi:MAG: alpha amylase C-terminal domain-containing protein, partial [Planctomycetia bacterium]|nr:alpha amylase C-terminal domain-containing protein [Planctomycetia bacterium]
DPIHRRYHHNELTFRGLYMFTENYALPLSHDEVVHGKGSLRDRMPGDDWQKFANLRLLFGYMYAQPGKKLLFMGGEFGQGQQWQHDTSLDWHTADYLPQAGLQQWVQDLNRVYRAESALHELDCSPAGFEWIDASDADGSILTFLRKNSAGDRIVVACNFTPVPRWHYRIGVPGGGYWRELLNSDAPAYWGCGQGNLGGQEAQDIPWHGRSHSLDLTLPPLGIVMFRSPGG